jgi:hypothetical protein
VGKPEKASIKSDQALSLGSKVKNLNEEYQLKGSCGIVMSKSILTVSKLLCCVAACGGAASTCGLTIVPTFDSSITGDPNGAAMMAGINDAIQDFETNYTDSLTVQIKFVSDSNVGLGQSSSWYSTVSYHSYLVALKSSAKSSNDTNAMSKLPNSTTDPVTGQSSINLNLPLGRLMGLVSGYGPDGFDGTISINMTLINLTRPPANFNHYDLRSVTEHEIDEVLGSSSSLPRTGFINPVDLFRYDTNLNRTYTTAGDNSYFSVDGTNLWARYNMNAGGDYGDWWSVSDIFWAPPGMTRVPQVQDAYADPGTFQDLGTNEFTLLDVIGYTLTIHPTPPTLIIVRSSPGHVTLSWTANVTGFSLEERTNLSSGSWIASPSGSSNPAIITASGAPKFYRLYQPAAPSIAQAQTAQAQPAMVGPFQSSTHVFQPPQP